MRLFCSPIRMAEVAVSNLVSLNGQLMEALHLLSFPKLATRPQPSLTTEGEANQAEHEALQDS